MNIEVLKKQIGKKILNSVDQFKEIDNMAILKNGKRKAKILLNPMDLYDIILKGDNINDHCKVKEDVYAEQLKDILNDHFNFSMLQAKRNNDSERLEEIKNKVDSGEKVRIL